MHRLCCVRCFRKVFTSAVCSFPSVKEFDQSMGSFPSVSAQSVGQSKRGSLGPLDFSKVLQEICVVVLSILKLLLKYSVVRY